jgi:hypothetical protein
MLIAELAERPFYDSELTPVSCNYIFTLVTLYGLQPTLAVMETNLFVLNSKTVYCSIIFANWIESTEFITPKTECEIFTSTEARFLPNASTQNRPPNSKLQQNAEFSRPDHARRHCLISMSYYHSRHRQNLFCISSASHEWCTCTVK